MDRPPAEGDGDVMDAWHTSCPRLPIWEDANDRGFVECRPHDDGGSQFVARRLLRRSGTKRSGVARSPKCLPVRTPGRSAVGRGGRSV